VDEDGVAEAIFADRDGQITACRKAPAGQTSAEILWQKSIGDDAIAAVVAQDLTGDGAPEIAVASRSGFLVLLAATGSVRWIRHARNCVTDVCLVPLDPHAPLLARSSTDGSVVVYDASGDERGRWNVGTPVTRLARAAGPAGQVLAAAGESRLAGATLLAP
jgi:hypothetical protein